MSDTDVVVVLWLRVDQGMVARGYDADEAVPRGVDVLREVLEQEGPAQLLDSLGPFSFASVERAEVVEAAVEAWRCSSPDHLSPDHPMPCPQCRKVLVVPFRGGSPGGVPKGRRAASNAATGTDEEPDA